MILYRNLKRFEGKKELTRITFRELREDQL